MRLRVETDQILLAHKSEDKILEMVHEIGAGIDLAPAIDERNISKQCTVLAAEGDPTRRQLPTSAALPSLLSRNAFYSRCTLHLLRTLVSRIQRPHPLYQHLSHLWAHQPEKTMSSIYPLYAKTSLKATHSHKP